MRFDQLVLKNARVRIAHPEDLIFDAGLAGAAAALNILKATAEHPDQISIKFDGSPALIFGRDSKGFSAIDKIEFNKLQFELPRSGSELAHRLFNRVPDQPGRANYAAQIGEVWRYLEQLIPESFQGFLQGDLMWAGRVPVVNGNFEFSPNKILYKVPVNSELGQQIANSSAGIAIHSFYADRQQHQSIAIDIGELNLNKVMGLVVLDPTIVISNPLNWPIELENQLRHLLTVHQDQLTDFFDPVALKKHQITDLPSFMKRYVNLLARNGQPAVFAHTRNFESWVVSDNQKITRRKAANFYAWLAQHRIAGDVTWQIVDLIVRIKYHLKSELDQLSDSYIHAELNGRKEQEGFVSDTRYGKIKLVDRSHFMRAVD